MVVDLMVGRKICEFLVTLASKNLDLTSRDEDVAVNKY